MDKKTIVEKQREYYQSGATRGYDFRLDGLKKLQQAIRGYESKICDALLSDLGKQPLESYMTEVGMVLDEVRFHIRHLKGWISACPLRWHNSMRSALSHPNRKGSC